MGRAKRDSKKNQHKAYQNDNRALTNKIAKTKKHIKKFPKDEKAAEFLEKLQLGQWKQRTKPLVPGSNKPDLATWLAMDFSIHGPAPAVQTAGEQISKLLGIPLPKGRVISKPKIIHKKKR